MTDVSNYYMHQAGSGLASFRGTRYQGGYGFFGRLLSGSVYPMLRFLGRNILNSGKNFAQDVFQSQDFSKQNLKDIAKQNIKKTATDILETAVRKMRGSGIKRKSQNIKKPIKRLGIKGGKLKKNKRVRFQIGSRHSKKSIKARKKVNNNNNLLF